MSKPNLTAERLRELFHYDPETGVFTRLVDAGRIRAGSIAGCEDNNGYLLIMIDYRQHKAHRLAWLYVHGVLPANQIDHIDGNPANNRIDNLRDVTAAVNQQNRKRAQTNNKLGFLGVTRSGNKFEAAIRLNKKVRHLGTFKTPEDAHQAYLGAKRRLHPAGTL